MLDVMCDLECFAVRSDAAIVAIGAVEFDLLEGVLGEEFYVIVGLGSSVAAGGYMDPSTVLWWLEQSVPARQELTRGGETIQNALTQFSEWMRGSGAWADVRLWGNGAGFDNVILGNAYDRCKIKRPWNHQNDWCYRTLKNMNRDIRMQPTEGSTHHNALDDARNQALHLIDIFQRRPGLKTLFSRSMNS